MTKPIDYQPAKPKAAVKPNLARGMLGWVLFGVGLTFIWMLERDSAHPHANGALGFVLFGCGAIMTLFVAIMLWVFFRYRWTAARWYRFRKMQIESADDFAPPTKKDEIWIEPLLTNTAREFSLKGFRELGRHRLGFLRNFWVPYMGVSQLHVSENGQVIAQALHNRLTSWVLLLLSFRTKGRSTDLVLISLLEDGRWLMTMNEPKLNLKPVVPPSLELIYLPACSLDALLDQHRQRLVQAVDSGATVKRVQSLQDAQRELLDQHRRQLPFYRSIGYVLPEEILPMLENITPKKRAQALLALKAARAADGFETVIPIQ